MSVRSLRVALVQMNSIVGALEENRRRIVEALAFSRSQGAELVVFPELALTGYPPEDLLIAPRFLRDCRRELEAILPHTRGLTAIVGYPELDVDPYNSAAVLHDGELVTSVRKQFLPNYGVFDEERYFQRGNEIVTLGLKGACIGVSICEDIWYPDGPPAWQALYGDAELLVNLSASPFERGKRPRRRDMLETRAADSNAMLAFVNMVGGQDELVFDGGSLICDARGRTLVEARAFEEGVLVYDCVIDSVLGNRLHDPRRRKSRWAVHAAGDIELAHFDLDEPAGLGKPAAEDSGEWKMVTLAEAVSADQPMAEDAEIYDALVLGLRDYVEKNGFNDVILGLSGGIDSALTAVIAVDALGSDRVRGLTMPSRFSSEGTKSDAMLLAENLGIRCQTVPIEPLFKSYLHALEPLFGDRDWNEAEENLQARIRGMLLMAVSNKFGPLVLTTGNKSEVSVGYSTLYGDMAGGFSVLKDVFKTRVFSLSRYRNTLSPVIPESTITRPPSAELRADQTDQDSLPPYEVLDAILEAYIEDDAGVEEIVARGFDAAVVEKIVRLVSRSEYKRRQAAPGVKITNRAFGRDRRLPITNRYVK